MLKVDTDPVYKEDPTSKCLPIFDCLCCIWCQRYPNTTNHTQETNQSYGPFKSSFCLRIQYKASLPGMFWKERDTRQPSPLFLFGTECPKMGVNLEDTFTKDFSAKAYLALWRKCGAAPLTRFPLQSDLVLWMLLFLVVMQQLLWQPKQKIRR
jgi:hypothetical protein